MATKVLECMGQQSHQVLMNMTIKISGMQPGDILEVTADCDTFEEDIGRWCKINNKKIQWIKDIGNSAKQCQILA